MKQTDDATLQQISYEHEENRIDELGAWALHQHNYQLERGQRVRTDEHDRAISGLHRVAKDILRPSYPLFSIERDRRRDRRRGRWVRSSSLGARLLRVLATDFDRIKMEYPLHNFSPVMMVFLKFRHHIPSNPASYFDQLMPAKVAEQILETALRALRVLQRLLLRSSVKRLHINFRRKAIDNFKGLIGSIDTLSRRRASVTTLRFDLYYRREGTHPVKFGDQPVILGLDELMGLRERFHRSLDRRFADALLGYAWVLEFGRERGFHIHYLVMLNPTGLDDDLTLVDMLETKWTALTQERGEFHSANRRKHEFKYPAMGLVRLDDPQVVTGLQFIVSYMTLAPLFVKLDIQDRYDTFAKGRFPALSALPPGHPGRRPSRIKISVEEAVARRLTFI